MLHLIFTDTALPDSLTHSIFLAGPSPRPGMTAHHWRHDAVKILQQLCGDRELWVFIPMSQIAFETGEFPEDFNYVNQIEWEQRWLNAADVIGLWAARDHTAKALTTNIEYGQFADSSRMVAGAPEKALSVRYIEATERNNNRPFFRDLTEMLTYALDLIGEGVQRHTDWNECLVPALIFRSEQFTNWYDNVLFAGNKLLDFRVKTVMGNYKYLFGFLAWANVWITDEDREKSNECIVGRTPTSYICAYHTSERGEREYVLVREFRTPANNMDGYVFELPGGSSFGDETPLETAAKELHEEIGIKIDDLDRFMLIDTRQNFATLAINEVTLYAVELTDSEWEQIKHYVHNGTVLGETDGERIRLVTCTDDTITDYPVDWSTLGMTSIVP